jgi:hypothetical protein
MLDVVEAVAAVGLVIAAVTAICMIVAKTWNRLFWLVDGKPSLSDDEQSLADSLAAQGQTETHARRTVIALRDCASSSPVPTPTVKEAHLSELEAALLDPVLGPELRRSPQAFADWVLALPTDHPIRRDFKQRYGIAV